MKSRILTIIVTYKNSPQQLGKLRGSLKENGITDAVFVDNKKDNVGYAGGINKALKGNISKYDYFFILNPDIVLKKDCLRNLLSVIAVDKDLGIVGPKILDTKGHIWAMGGELNPIRYSGGLLHYGKPNRAFKEKLVITDFISGTAMLIRKEVFEKIGLFRDDYFLYYEDVDFCLRARKAGFCLAVVPSAEIVHAASSSTGKGSPLMQYYMARNHLIFMQRFAPLHLKIRELIRLPKTLYQAKKRKYELLGIRDYFIRKWGKNDYWR